MDRENAESAESHMPPTPHIKPADGLEQRLNYRRAMEDRLLAILEEFIEAGDDVEQAIADALAGCAQFARADMGYIMRVSEMRTTFSMSNMWQEQTVKAEALTIRDIPVEMLPEQTRAGLVLRIEDVSALPNDLSFKISLQEHGVRALLDVPIKCGDELLGAVGLSNLTTTHAWTEEEQLLLQFFAGTLGHALLRSRATKQRRQLEEQLHQAQRMDVAARTATGIAHDFRNMLTVVLACADMAANPSVSAVERFALIADIQGAAVRAAELASSLLRLGGPQPTPLGLVDIGILVRDLTPTLRRILTESVELTVALPSFSAIVKGSVQDLEQAITNLCVNARDAMSNRGVVFVAIERQMVSHEGLVNGLQTAAGAYVVVSVRDQGKGISLEDLPRLFEPFFTTKLPEQGTGLGLTTVYATCKRHNGWIDIDTQVGRGSEFKMYLPMVVETSD